MAPYEVQRIQTDSMAARVAGALNAMPQLAPVIGNSLTHAVRMRRIDVRPGSKEKPVVDFGADSW
jgi:hypothetical protein